MDISRAKKELEKKLKGKWVSLKIEKANNKQIISVNIYDNGSVGELPEKIYGYDVKYIFMGDK